MSTKLLAFLLVVAAFLAGAFVAVLDPVTVNWGWMGAVLAFGAVGLWLFRTAHHREASAGHRLSEDMRTLGGSLNSILSNLEALCERGDELPVYQARFEIDRLFRKDLNEFAEARETMVHVFGIQNYAEVMSAFAAGERYINRVWSASTDGYEQEVRDYLEKARRQFAEANGLFGRLRADVGHDAAVRAS